METPLKADTFASPLITKEQAEQAWKVADKDNSGTLDFKEITRLLDKLNIKLKEKEVKKKFQEVDKDGSKNLTFGEFTDFLNRLQVRPEMNEIFYKYSDKNGVFTADILTKFLKSEQKEPNAAEESKKILAEFSANKTTLNVAEFQAYLSSTSCNRGLNNKATIYQDLSHPFAHYWIASSHNTYLMEDQLRGPSSVEAYKHALLKGCRCVELDCWDGSDIEMPIIYHGHTLTSKITFKEVLETVRDFGFKTTEYPVILSLEVHCSIEGQVSMAKWLQEILGGADMLPPSPTDDAPLPPPEKLRKKVLVKGKMVHFEDSEDDPEDAMPDNVEELAKSDLKSSTSKELKSSKDDKKEKKEEKKEDKKEEKKGEKKSEKKPSSTAVELSKCVHMKAVKFIGFDEFKVKGKPWEISSFGESKSHSLCTKSPVQYVDYNSRGLSRIYPKGSRIDSSNYDPCESWACGAQVVALNYQTGSEPTWVNDGKFIENGLTGYVLKPSYMLGPNITFNPFAKAKAAKTLEVTVISAFKLPKVAGKEANQKGEVIDPYVKISLHGIEAEKKPFKTKTVDNNGFNPNWNQTFKFPVTYVELGILLFVVNDADLVGKDDFIAQFALPLTTVREGFRTLPLRDKRGHYYSEATLFVHFKWA